MYGLIPPPLLRERSFPFTDPRDACGGGAFPSEGGIPGAFAPEPSLNQGLAPRALLHLKPGEKRAHAR